MALRGVPKFGLAIDWETSGYSWPKYAEKHQGISFGAVIFSVETFEVVEEPLYREIKFLGGKYLWDMGAERVHGLTQAHLAANGIDQQQAAGELCNLVLKFFNTGDIPLLGHRVYFDRDFTNQLTGSIGVDLTWDPTTFDTCSFGTALIGITKSDDLFEAMGLPPRGAHNALEDILYTLKSMQIMKSYFTLGLETALARG